MKNNNYKIKILSKLVAILGSATLLIVPMLAIGASTSANQISINNYQNNVDNSVEQLLSDEILTSSSNSAFKENDLLYVKTADEQGYSVSAAPDAVISGELVIPNNYMGLPVTEIAENGFKNQTQIASVVIPDDVVLIRKAAFQSCENLTSVDIPASVTEIKADAFWYCPLTLINIDPNNQNYKKATNVGPDATVIVSGGTSKLNNECSNIAPGLVTGSVALVEGDATTIRISGAPGTTKTSFMVCWGLTSIVIPASVNEITAVVFRSCKNLTSITMLDEETPPSLGFNAFLGVSPDLKIYVPPSALEIYKKTDVVGWTDEIKALIRALPPEPVIPANNNLAIIIGCSVGGVVLLGAVTAGTIIYLKKYKNKR